VSALVQRVRRICLAWPWWIRVLAVFAATRVFTTAVLLLAWWTQVGGAPRSWAYDTRPPLAVFLGRWWDGWWYQQIATGGYPSTLPTGPGGSVERNAWAFFPLYPMLVRAVTAVTGIGGEAAAVAVSVLLAGGAMLVLYRLVEVGAPRAVAARPGLPLATVTLVAVYPTSPVLQLAYTESLALLLLATSLLLVVRRRYWWAMIPVVALGFTRAVTLPMALVVVVHGAIRCRGRRTSPLPRRDLVALVGLTAVACVSGVAWPVIGDWVTKAPDGYLMTQEAWRVHRGVGPFDGWARLATMPWWLAVLVLGTLATLIALLASRSARRLGPELYAWSAGYVLYLVVVSDLITSLLRFLMLAFPLGAVTVGLVTTPPRRAGRWFALVVVCSLVLQVAWVWVIWRDLPASHHVGAP